MHTRHLDALPRRTALILTLMLGLFGATTAHAEDDREIGVLAGLNQPIIAHGGNLQLEVVHGRFVFDYSHGWSLDIPAAGAARDQHLALYLPYSTGLGVGYRIIRALDIRFEPKLHRFDVSLDDGMEGVRPRIASYKTITLGVGAYYTYRPFQRGALAGIAVVASLRLWPNVWSSLDQDRVGYDNPVTGRHEVHEAANIGIANTPLIANLSVGYVFPF